MQVNGPVKADDETKTNSKEKSKLGKQTEKKNLGISSWYSKAGGEPASFG